MMHVFVLGKWHCPEEGANYQLRQGTWRWPQYWSPSAQGFSRYYTSARDRAYTEVPLYLRLAGYRLKKAGIL